MTERQQAGRLTRRRVPRTPTRLSLACAISCISCTSSLRPPCSVLHAPADAPNTRAVAMCPLVVGAVSRVDYFLISWNPEQLAFLQSVKPVRSSGASCWTATTRGAWTVARSASLGTDSVSWTTGAPSPTGIPNCVVVHDGDECVRCADGIFLTDAATCEPCDTACGECSWTGTNCTACRARSMLVRDAESDMAHCEDSASRA